MAKKSCKHPPCKRRASALGWCNAHYHRQKHGRDMDAPFVTRGARNSMTALRGAVSLNGSTRRLEKVAKLLEIPPAKLVEKIVRSWLDNL
jgi:hypothetical protein